MALWCRLLLACQQENTSGIQQKLSQFSNFLLIFKSRVYDKGKEKSCPIFKFKNYLCHTLILLKIKTWRFLVQ